MNLVIVESPTKARTLSRFLGEDFSVEATMGHVKDLPKNRLAVDIENAFKPQYLIISKRKETLGRIKKAAKKSERIYLATDPDREGEAIAAHVSEILSEKDTKILRYKDTKSKNGKTPSTPVSKYPSILTCRIVFHEITKEALRQALRHPRDIDTHLVESQTARRVLDRLVGYKLSPLLWKKIRRGLSAGRVQSVTVRLIVEREREIEAFVPKEYWEIFAQVVQAERVGQVEKEGFLVKLIKIGDKKAEIKNGQDADKVVSDLEKADYKVFDLKKREVAKSPFPPFSTSTLTQAAARLFFWSAKKTMSIAQRLYEEGLITYHRTDSTNLAQQAITNVRQFIKEKYGENYLPEKPRVYRTKSKVAQEAHEAIRPTDVGQISNLKSQISNRDEQKLYELIWKKFVACQMVDAVYDETTIDVEALGTRQKAIDSKTSAQSLLPNAYLLRASGQILKFDGWKKIFGGSDTSLENVLPEVSPGDPLQLIKVLSQQKFTEPPPRYTEATLIKTLEKLGIGRPSTYAPIISTIQVRNYVEKMEGKFHPTPLGTAVNDFLVEQFPDVVDYKFTAHMEDDLDAIANGKREWTPIVREFWQPFSEKLKGVEEKAGRVKVEVEDTGEVCPKCGKGNQVIRIGRFGKFLSCSRFPECDWTQTYVEKIGMACPDCAQKGLQGEVVIKRTKKGKRFYGCSRYPECKWASWRKPVS